MSHSYVRTASKVPASLRHESGSWTSSAVDFEGEPDEELLESAKALLRASHEPVYIEKSRFPSLTRLASWVLHLLLVGIHLALIVVWAKGLEQTLTFSLDHQKTASLVITGITTAFITIYSALLVFVTQSLSMQRSLQMSQPLTATHDTSAAWTGIGSAALHMWRQWAVPASPLGVILIFLYLGGVIVLHISTPALFTLQTFNATRLVPVSTQGLPAYTWPSNVNDSLKFYGNMTGYAISSLRSLPSIWGNTTEGSLGLHDGTLYDVLGYNPGTGNVSVDATGFNVTCGFVPDARTKWTSKLRYGVTSPTNWPNLTEWGIPSTRKDMTIFIAIAVSDNRPEPGVIVRWVNTGDSVVFYTTNPIVDSNGNLGHWADLKPRMDSSVSAIQIFRCSLGLVKQTAVVDSQSRTMIDVEPKITKTSSGWRPYNGPGLEGPYLLSGGSEDVDTWPLPDKTAQNPLLETWGRWMFATPQEEPMLDAGDDIAMATVDVYLIKKLNLHPFLASPNYVMLHDVENALSIFVASMFWTRHNVPTSELDGTVDPDTGHNVTVVATPKDPPFLLQGQATVTELIVKVRLELNIIAVSGGLVASILLTILSLPSSLYRGRRRLGDVQINGTGILDIIWLYRNHPDLQRLILPAQDLTNTHLRQGGMVQTRLVTGHVRRREIF
ncbi:hypothetical protein DFH06DRAFT_1434353 [Mycena polygramma]|nr:hypothetical protein DFH06DRAFT_1434353 [Mycena polygramma]